MAIEETGITRRDFLKVFGLAAFGLFIPGTAGATSPEVSPKEVDLDSLIKGVSPFMPEGVTVNKDPAGFIRLTKDKKDVGNIVPDRQVLQIDQSAGLKENKIKDLLTQMKDKGVLSVHTVGGADLSKDGLAYYLENGQLAQAFFPNEWENLSPGEANLWAVPNGKETQLVARVNVNRDPIVQNVVWIDSFQRKWVNFDEYQKDPKTEDFVAYDRTGDVGSITPARKELQIPLARTEARDETENNSSQTVYRDRAENEIARLDRTAKAIVFSDIRFFNNLSGAEKATLGVWLAKTETKAVGISAFSIYDPKDGLKAESPNTTKDGLLETPVPLGEVVGFDTTWKSYDNDGDMVCRWGTNGWEGVYKKKDGSLQVITGAADLFQKQKALKINARVRYDGLGNPIFTVISSSGKEIGALLVDGTDIKQVVWNPEQMTDNEQKALGTNPEVAPNCNVAWQNRTPDGSGRKQSLWTLERTNATSPKITDPNSGFSGTEGNGVHLELVGNLGYDSLFMRSARVVRVVDASKGQIVVYVGYGQPDVTVQLPPPDRFYLYPRVWKKGVTTGNAYRFGGNACDLEAGDLMALLATTPGPLVDISSAGGPFKPFAAFTVE